MHQSYKMDGYGHLCKHLFKEHCSGVLKIQNIKLIVVVVVASFIICLNWQQLFTRCCQASPSISAVPAPGEGKKLKVLIILIIKKIM